MDETIKREIEYLADVARVSKRKNDMLAWEQAMIGKRRLYAGGKLN